MHPDIITGATCPDFKLPNQKDEEVLFSELLKQAPYTALVFYRGHW